MTTSDFACLLGAHRIGSSRCWRANCPAHDDSFASLSIWEGNDGGVSVFCEAAGCSPSKILKALRLKRVDLFVGPPPTSKQTQADVLLRLLRTARANGYALDLPRILRAGIIQHRARVKKLRAQGFHIEGVKARYDGIKRKGYRLNFDPEMDNR